MTPVTAAIARNAPRQPIASDTAASGVEAISAPSPPMVKRSEISLA